MEKNSVTCLKGVGKSRAGKLENLGIETISDLLYHLPRSYLDYSKYTPTAEIRDGQAVLVKGTVSSDVRCIHKGKLDIYKFEVIGDGDSFGVPRLSVTLFNQKFVAENVKKGEPVVLYGKAEVFGNILSMTSPDIEFSEETQTGLRPVYPLTEGISQKIMQKTEAAALDFCFEEKDGKIISKTDIVKESLPESVRKEFGLCSLCEAFVKIHRPQTESDIKEARRRLAFEEILIFRLGLSTLKMKMHIKKAVPLKGEFPAEFATFLPFEMTKAQKRVIFEAVKDMQKPFPMSRVVQGDVGSGKTAVAAALCYYAVKNDGQ